jgi:uncharacterized membrane protein
MKYVFNNKRILTFTLLFALSILLFIVLLLCRWVFHLGISSLVLVIVLVCVLSSGGYLAQLRSEPPW